MPLDAQHSHSGSEPQLFPDESDETNARGSFTAQEAPPLHPIPLMQGAFNESIMESTEPSECPESNNPEDQASPKADAEARRQQLLELEDFSDEYSSRWRQKPGAKFHPLWKLIAQISFGVHLLQQNLAKSQEEVLRILQVHVDEVDGFLEDTTADFELAISDVQERVRFLRLPLEHGETFNTMLMDKGFRTAIVDGNDVIERIIDRTTRAMNNSLLDISQGIDATAELAKFLERLGTDWTKEDERLLEIYNTMRGNAEGWWRTFNALQDKGAGLEKLLTELGVLAIEMSRRAGAASRRHTMNSTSAATSKSSTPKRSPRLSNSPTSKRDRRSNLDKPLPPDPLQKLLSKSPPIPDRDPAHTARSENGSPKDQSPSGSERPPRKSSSRSREAITQQPTRIPTPPSALTQATTSDTESPSSTAPEQPEVGPVELHANSIQLEPDTNYSTLIPIEQPRNMSPHSTSESEPTADSQEPESSPTSVIDSAYSSDLEPVTNIAPQRRHSYSEISSGALRAEDQAELTAVMTALPQFPHSSQGRWALNGKKSFASMRGIFNKKRPLKDLHTAILV